MRTEPAWAMMKFPADLAATLVEIDARVAQVKARPRASAWSWAADGTGTSLAAVSGIVTCLMQFSSLPSGPGRSGALSVRAWPRVKAPGILKAGR
jgi:hypothetical protein